MLPLEFGPDILGDLSSALSREWLETNGLGSFASGTLSGANTRRYHGLLVCATTPPVGRLHLVSKVSEMVRCGEASFPLDTNVYPGAIHPAGFRHAVSASLSPVPRFVFAAHGVTLEKLVFMPHEHQATVVRYTVTDAPGEVLLELRPLLGCRDFHSLTAQNTSLDPRPHLFEEGHVTFEPYSGVPAIHLYHDAGEFHPGHCWFRNLEYPAERARGLPCREDNWSPGILAVRLRKGESVALIFSAGPFGVWRPAGRSARQPSARPPSAEALLESEERRRKCLAGPFQGKGGLLEALAVASDRFLVRRSPGHSVLAGYPWFEDWGRDTFISLPGLALTMGRHAIAAEVLAEFARFVKDGMLPNRFPDFAAEPEYNSVDAPLWFIHAVGRFLEASDDLEEVRDRFLPVMEAIVDAYRNGTRYGIGMDDDGLIAAGEPGMQLTWMDARHDGIVFTPRHGKPVEIQALWHSALCTLEVIHYELDNPLRAHEYGALAARVRESFERKFWLEDAGYCADVADDPNRDGAADRSLRPNQLFAAALPYPLLDAPKSRRMLEAVRARLLTPVGLRTLSPADPGYIAHYRGGSAERDAAYHNGTVWPWLLGAYCDAVVTANSGWQPAALTEIRAVLAGFEKHLSEAGLGGVSEIFEPEPPYTPVGCTHQAWSVAELLRIAAEAEKHE